MSYSPPCGDCGHEVPPSLNSCPHCGRPGRFPNVLAARNPAELAELESRYQIALADTLARKAEAPLNGFIAAVADSQAVICYWLGEAERLASSDNELYASYYGKLRGGSRAAKGEDWDSRRISADGAFFPNYQEEIKFAALTLDGLGLKSYGPCSMLCRTEMIAHRASVTEENTVLLFEKLGVRADKLPLGYRATWDERAKICVIKLADKIEPITKHEEYPAMLAQQGADSANESCVEVHIYGSLTIRSLEKISVRLEAKSGKQLRIERLRYKTLVEKLKKFGVKLELVSTT